MNFLVKLHEVCRFHELHFIKFHEAVDDDFMNFTSRTFEVGEVGEVDEVFVKCKN